MNGSKKMVKSHIRKVTLHCCRIPQRLFRGCMITTRLLNACGKIRAVSHSITTLSAFRCQSLVVPEALSLDLGCGVSSGTPLNNRSYSYGAFRNEVQGLCIQLSLFDVASFEQCLPELCRVAFSCYRSKRYKSCSMFIVNNPNYLIKHALTRGLLHGK